MVFALGRVWRARTRAADALDRSKTIQTLCSKTFTDAIRAILGWQRHVDNVVFSLGRVWRARRAWRGRRGE